MALISYTFPAFAAALLFIYYIVPKRMQWRVILGGSLIFYAASGIDNLLIVLFTSATSYFFSRRMQANIKKQEEMTAGLERKEARAIKDSMKKKRKRLLVAALAVVIGILAFLKYFNFAVSTIGGLLGIETAPVMGLAAPLGISYYTFMLISYLVDVYKAKIEPDGSIAKFLAYILYFPQITQGPIARYGEVAPQIFAPHSFDYDSFRKGMWLMIWGFFKKLVIANNIAGSINGFMLWDNGQESLTLLFGLFMFSIQLYADFSGCMDIVRGVSQCFGITLSENFERPYFAKTLPEFWRRWHITLGSFFREYIFYPVSTTKLFLMVNTKSRKLFGAEAGRVIASCIPIMSVWLLTGLWHGASANFIAWGCFHGILICLSTAIERPSEIVCAKLHINRESGIWHAYQMLRTFFLCMLGRAFFVSDSLHQAVGIIRSIFSFNGKAEEIAFYYANCAPKLFVAAVGSLVLLASSIAQERMKKKGDTDTLRDKLIKCPLPLRWAILLAGLGIILLFGVYGNETGSVFVYERF